MGLNEIVVSRINRAINEELSVAKWVEDTSRKIFNKVISQEFPKGESQTNFNLNGVSIQCNYYFFDTPKDFGIYKPQQIAGSLSLGNTKTIYLNLCYVSGQLVKNDLYDSIYHEVEHLYQQTQSKTDFQNRKDDSFYQTVRQTLYTSPKIEERKIAAALYLTFDYELNAYINGLYGELTEMQPIFPKDIDSIVKQSSLYKMILYSEDALKIIETNGSKYLKPFEEYHFTMNWFVRRIRKTLKKAYTKIGKIITRYKKTILEAFRGGQCFDIRNYLFEGCEQNVYYVPKLKL